MAVMMYALLCSGLLLTMDFNLSLKSWQVKTYLRHIYTAHISTKAESLHQAQQIALIILNVFIIHEKYYVNYAYR